MDVTKILACTDTPLSSKAWNWTSLTKRTWQGDHFRQSWGEAVGHWWFSGWAWCPFLRGLCCIYINQLLKISPPCSAWSWPWVMPDMQDIASVIFWVFESRTKIWEQSCVSAESILDTIDSSWKKNQRYFCLTKFPSSYTSHLTVWPLLLHQRFSSKAPQGKMASAHFSENLDL